MNVIGTLRTSRAQTALVEVSPDQNGILTARLEVTAGPGAVIADLRLAKHDCLRLVELLQRAAEKLP